MISTLGILRAALFLQNQNIKQVFVLQTDNSVNFNCNGKRKSSR